MPFIYECAKELQLVNSSGVVIDAIPWRWDPKTEESNLASSDVLKLWFHSYGAMNWHRDIPGNPDKFKRQETNPQWRFKGVLLEIGHGPTNQADPGAVHPTHKVTEHDMNIVAANEAANIIKAAGVPCTVTNQVGSLYTLGKMRRDYDLFVSIHHNAFNTRAQYTMTMVHKRKQDKADRVLGELVSKHMSKLNGFQDQGVKDWTNLGILSGAEDVEKDPDYQASILAECYFIDNHYLRKDDFERLSKLSGQGIGEGCLAYLKQANP